MDKRYAIFDMDGTLVDSMGYWRDLAGEFLASRGVTSIPPDILEQMKPLTVPGSAALFIREFGLSGTPESLAAEINAMMEGHYRNDIPLKPGAGEYLAALRRRGVRMCAASATVEPLMEACLKRLGVLEHFQFLLSCETVGVGKHRPDVYMESARRLGGLPQDTAVYEDAIFAATTAKKAGFFLVGVYDESAGPHWAELKELADETIWDYREVQL